MTRSDVLDRLRAYFHTHRNLFWFGSSGSAPGAPFISFRWREGIAEEEASRFRELLARLHLSEEWDVEVDEQGMRLAPAALLAAEKFPKKEYLAKLAALDGDESRNERWTTDLLAIERAVGDSNAIR